MSAILDLLSPNSDELSAFTKLLRNGVSDGIPRSKSSNLDNVPVDIVETAKSYEFYFDVPGLSKSDIQVTLEEENVLVVKSGGSGTKRKREEQEGEEEGCKYLRMERKTSAMRFARKFRLPENAKLEGITARCENGVLKVVVEKVPPPKKETKTVEVKVV